MNQSFLSNLGANIPDHQIKQVAGLSYLNAATAMALAGRPDVQFVNFNDQPYMDACGGYLVAVDVPVADKVQRLYLPVLDESNKPVKKPTLRDVTDSQQRALVKALAITTGVGMSLYLGHDGKGEKSLKALKLEGASTGAALDIATLEPLVRSKEGNPEATYVEWGAAVAVARATDPTFIWNIVHYENRPYRLVLGGVLVDVEVTYQGRTFVQSLPVMDAAFEPMSASDVTVFHWNTTVMRCLAKAIAFCTGYGLSVYGDVALTAAPAVDKAKPGRKAKVEPEKAPASSVAAEASEPVTAASVGASDVAAPVEPAAEPVASEAPPVETPPVVAEATPEAAPADTAEAAPAEPEALGRFRGVIAARAARGFAEEGGLLTVFAALAGSTRYAEEDKPMCFGELVLSTASRVTPATADALLTELVKYKAFVHVPDAVKQQVRERIVAVAAQQGLGLNDEGLMALMNKLVEAGVVADVEDVCVVLRAVKMESVAELITDMMASA